LIQLKWASKTHGTPQIREKIVNKVKKTFNSINTSLEKIHRRITGLAKTLEKIVPMFRAVDFLAALAPVGQTGNAALKVSDDFAKMSANAVLPVQ
jgi:hypothetical protein